MPRINKEAVSRYIATGCRRQFFLYLYPENAAFADERTALNIPRTQDPRPGLEQFTQAGDAWQTAKIEDLARVFGAAQLIGNRSPEGSFSRNPIQNALPTAISGTFLVEAEFDNTRQFLTNYGLESFLDSRGNALGAGRFRPDLIAVNPPGFCTEVINTEGRTITAPAEDQRLQLQIVEIKLTSDPSPSYFCETVLYSIALATWLEVNGLSDRFVVSANPAVWPGSHSMSNLGRLEASETVPSREEFLDALREDWILTPYEVFLTRLRQLLTIDIPETLSTTDWRMLPWHVDNRCKSCEYIGYEWTARDPESRRNPLPEHCLPQAEADNHLSRIAFISRGAASSLRQSTVDSVTSVAQLPADHAVFGEHHGLRQSRHIIANRAQSLISGQAIPPDGQATVATLPRYADRKIYLTIDFEISQALTFSIGMLVGGMPPGVSGFTSTGDHFARKQFVVASQTLEQERTQLVAFLQSLHAVISAPGTDGNSSATYQIYIWDELQYRHLCRIIGRHLDFILQNNQVSSLAWLFPPEEVLANPVIQGECSPITILRNAVRSLVAAPVAHYYNLLGTARSYHYEGLDPQHARFRVHPLFEDPLSDMIPSERAHDVWSQSAEFATTMQRLSAAVNERLAALYAIERRLVADLAEHLSFQAPRFRRFEPDIMSGSVSVDGRFWYLHAKLCDALDNIEKKNIRALLPYEREARFHSAHLTERLDSVAGGAICAERGIRPNNRTFVYRVSPLSRDAKIQEGDINFAICPRNSVGLLDESVRWFTRTSGVAANYTDKWRLKMADILNVNVLHFDRKQLLVIVELSDYAHQGDHVLQLEQEGFLDLSQDVMLDPVHKDFFLKKLDECIKAIGNPSIAPNNGAVRRAVNLRRNSRFTPETAPSKFLWRATATAALPFLEDTTALRTTIEPFVRLNTSQWQAWQESLQRRCRLIWGPPGTGKSHTLQAIILAAVLHGKTTGTAMRIGVSGFTYTAIDNVLTGMRDRIDSCVPSPNEVSISRIRSSLGRANPPDGVVDVMIESTLNPESSEVVAALNPDGNSCTVVGGTPFQIFKLAKLAGESCITDLFDLLIIDEASQMSVAHALLPLCALANDGALILAGDPKQLAPIQSAEAPEALRSLVGGAYSFFKDRGQVPEVSLEINYRSNAAIVGVAHAAGYSPTLRSNSPNLTIELLDPLPGAQPRGWPPQLAWSPALNRLLDPAVPVSAFTYSNGVCAQQNPFEAQLIVSLCLLLSGRLADHPSGEMSGDSIRPPSTTPYTPEEFWKKGIGIVTPHRAQQALIIGLLCSAFPDVNPLILRSAVDTVERYQGQERDIILVSYAVGDADVVAEEEEFLMSLNRFNVTASRARCKMIVLLTRELLDHIPSDIDVIWESSLLKKFATSYCSVREPLSLPAILGESHIEIQGEFCTPLPHSAIGQMHD